MKSIKGNSGITLITLAVTIVVILILAGVTLDVTLGENGILNKSKEAANRMNNLVKEDEAELNELLDELNETMDSNWDSNIEIPEENLDLTYTEDGVPIPAGFYYVGGTKSEGVVISDNVEDKNKGINHEIAKILLGNQFVWIPVENKSEFKRYNNYFDGSLNSFDVLTISEEPSSYATEEERREYSDMIQSVYNNKGFYIGRYEAGIKSNMERTEQSYGVDEEVVIKQGAYVYNYIGWADTEETTNQLGGAVQKSREMYTGKKGYNVKSCLVYGVQWDAIMAFIDPKYKTSTCSSTSFVANTRGKGNFTGKLAVTGSNSNYSIKNIYDLGGNVMEWTMETRTGFGMTNCRFYRGVQFTSSARDCVIPVTGIERIVDSGQTRYEKVGNIGFRIALYL